MAFAHLHVHTEYSLLDGACRIERLLDRAKALGQTSVAITDHGVMYGVVDFYKAAKARGIKPIIGCEIYVARRGRTDRVHGLDNGSYHLVLLCKNEIGYRNLVAIVSKAWTEGFYSKPRADLELLRAHSEGLIALSACLAGEIPRALSAGDYEGAKEIALRYRDIFGAENFYMELQDHRLREQAAINPQIIRLSRETGIPLVVTNDCHYIEKEDARMHRVLICIQTNTTVDDENVLEFGSDEFYVKSEEEMRSLFPDCPEAADNAQKIADRCCVEFEFGRTKLPRFEAPDGGDTKDYLRKLCYDGLHRLYGPHPEQSVVDRLEYEIDTITSMGYTNYYLIVWDFIREAKSRGIPVGPGRGSGVGSLAAYCIGITGVDPLRYDLLFERFLNPERVSMPDFDIDFSDERRGEIIEYVVEKYGADHVAQIVTFGTMAARLAIRDVGRALGVPYNVCDSVAKLVPMELGVTLDSALKNVAELREKYESDPTVRDLIDMSRRVEGMPRHASTHAAGIVITDRPVMDYVPLSLNDDAVVTQFTMTTIEELGLLKMDFLGLRYLSIIEHAEQMIRKHTPGFSVADAPDNDPEVFGMIAAGQTEGIFQFESAGMRRLIVQSVPRRIEDLIAVVSLYRPGPMQFIPAYVENSRHPDHIQYLTPKLKGILDVTYGCIIYQEQVMRIFRELAGYSLGRADIVRRAMSKKKHKVMEEEREYFIHGLKDENGNTVIEGCIARGVDEKTAETIYEEMKSFASYAFNKSHAAAYAVVAYRTAYLKYHYPKEYMAALLTSVLGASGKLASYREECARLNIPVLPPHVNESDLGFSVSGDGIRFGLLAIRNLGRGAIERMLEERRRGGPFTGFYDFCRRMQGKELNRRAVESLVRCGALDGLGNNRREMLLAIGPVFDDLESDKRRNIEGQLGFFDVTGEPGETAPFEMPRAEDFTETERFAMERDVTGMYLSGHPMQVYAAAYASGAVARADRIAESAAGESERYRDGQPVRMLGIVTDVKRKATRGGASMAFVTLEDLFGSIEVLVFPKVLERFRPLVQTGGSVLALGRISFTEEKEPKLVCEELSAPPAPEALARTARQEGSLTNAEKRPAPAERPGLYLRLPSKDSPKAKKALRYTAVFDGGTEMYLYYEDTKKLVRAPANLRVAVNPVLISALEDLLGEDDVALRE